MIKKGYTAVPKHDRAIAWKERRSHKNRTRIPIGTSGVVVGFSYAQGYAWPRANIGGVVHTLHPWDWEFTTVREGELRCWKDERSAPFMVVKIGRLESCQLIGDGRIFGTTCRYVEEYSEVINEAG